MNIKSIFDPIDRLIHQAKGFIEEQDTRKQYLQRVEDKVEIIRPEIEDRKAELVALGNQVDSDEKLKLQIESTVEQLNCYLENITLIAEKELALEILSEGIDIDHEGRKEERSKYTEHQVVRLREQLKITLNFFEAADFANEIWADFDLFEEFSCDDTVVQLLVDRMNETNTKNTETRMGKDLRKTLEHIRMNLVKSTAWTDQEFKDYKAERNIKLKQLAAVKIPTNRPFNVTVVGSAREIVDDLGSNYNLPPKLVIKWFDITSNIMDKGISEFNKCDLIVFQTLNPHHPKLQEIKELLDNESCHYVNVVSLEVAKLINTVEDELIKISFQEQFSGK
ncbi:MAG: hypothetical protein GY786_06270 [Proteobacteria bacterium]|nr:hypothetical protein [Pseudomonadota bacterium]